MTGEYSDHADVKVPPPILAVLHIIAAFLLQRVFPLYLPFAYIFPVIGGLFVLLGLGLSFTAIREFARAHTALDPHASVSTVVMSGPYQFTRNPIYLGFVCMLIGFPMLFGTWWGLILVPAFILLINTLVIQHEEAYLEKKFGDTYTNYTSRVRRWL